MSKAKTSLHYAIVKFCKDNKYELIQEYRFNPERRWKADYFITDLNCLIEFEGMGGRAKGGIGGHQTLNGYTKNCDKYNSACLLGFNLLRFTAANTNTFTELITKLKNKL
jgi:hypothetical protein